MTDTPEKRRPISPPQANEIADASRAATRAIAGSIPIVGAIVTEVAGFVTPDPTAMARKRWEQEITGEVNSLGEQIGTLDPRPRSTIDGPTALVLQYLIKRCPDGLARAYLTADAIAETMPEMTTVTITEALEELDSFGLIENYESIGSPSRYRLREHTYAMIDPQVMGWDTEADARELARLALQQGEAVEVLKLEKETGWSRRRLNPALRIVLSMIEYGRISRELQPNYVTGYFYTNGSERAKMRRFANGV